jgi:hypothetical protein
MVALFVILTIIAFLLADAVVLWVRKHREAATAVEASQPWRDILPEPALPGGVFLSPAHLWVGLVPSGQARIGLDPLVLAAMGRPDRIDGPVPGVRVRKGEPLFSAHWGSRSILFRAPIEGIVQAGALAGDPEGAVLTMEPAHAASDLKALPLAETARQWFSQEWARLRDFVAAQTIEAAPAMAMPDGGTPASGWLKQESDATWDRFVASFLTEEQNAH